MTDGLQIKLIYYNTYTLANSQVPKLKSVTLALAMLPMLLVSRLLLLVSVAVWLALPLLVLLGNLLHRARLRVILAIIFPIVVVLLLLKLIVLLLLWMIMLLVPLLFLLFYKDLPARFLGFSILNSRFLLY